MTRPPTTCPECPESCLLPCDLAGDCTCGGLCACISCAVERETLPLPGGPGVGGELPPGQQRLIHPLTATRLTGRTGEKPYQRVRAGTIIRCWYASHVESEWVWVVFKTRQSTYKTRRFALLAALGELP